MSEPNHEGISVESSDNKASKLVVSFGNVSLINAGTPDCALKVADERFKTAIDSPLLAYAFSLILERAAVTDINDLRINRKGSSRLYATQEMEYAQGLVQGIDGVIAGNLRFTDSGFKVESHGLAVEAFFAAMCDRLDLPFQVASWMQDWTEATDFRLFPETKGSGMPVDLTTMSWLDKLAQSYRDRPEVAHLVLPHIAFSKSIPGHGGIDLFAGKFDETTCIQAVTKTMTALAKEDSVHLHDKPEITRTVAKAATLEATETAKSDPEAMKRAKDTMLIVTQYNNKLMEALVNRPNIIEPLRLAKEHTTKTLELIGAIKAHLYRQNK